MSQQQQPHEVAERILDWFPHGSFTYDTYVKLRQYIANAIRYERSVCAVSRPTQPWDHRPLCSCKASAREGRHMNWCPAFAVSRPDRGGAIE